MEKKKLLLVAISVGLFLVITIGAALIFAPKNSQTASGAVTSRPAGGTDTGFTVPPPPSHTPPLEAPGSSTVDPVVLVRNPGDAPLLQPPPEASSGDSDASGSSQTGINGGTVITVTRPVSAAEPNAPQTPRPVPVAAAPAAPRPAQVKSTAAQSKPAAEAKVYSDYWVQTGAFSTIAKAEGVKETLASKGITSLIENREVGGRTLFRVRVGPYTSQNEANYWLSLIKTINGFEDSQVRQTQSRR